MQLSLSADSQLSALFGLSTTQLDKVMAAALNGRDGQGVYCDVYFETGTDQVIAFDQGIIKGIRKDNVRGAGVRVVIGDKSGYSFTDHVNVTSLKQAAVTARAIADHAPGAQPVRIGPARKSTNDLYTIDVSPVGVSLDDKIALLKKIDAVARAYDPRIKNVSVQLSVEERTIIIANSFGGDKLIIDRRPLIHMSVSCQAQEGERIEMGSDGGGGRYELDFFQNGDRWKTMALTAAKEAVNMLSAIDAPGGEMTVVLGPGWPGVLIHEAVGHGLEGDFNRKGTSAFAGRIGEKVASDLCTIIDEGVVPGKRGSLNVDDEGTPTGRTVLIENGILMGYMQDNQNAALMGMASTGNCRRESYRHKPMPRMTNTSLVGGQSTPEEIIRSVKRGLYALSFPGGDVNITNGNFTFSTSGAYLIEDGKITRAVKGATLIGNGPKALQKVTMVGNDAKLDEGIGNCGKNGQSVPVGVGMPTIRIEDVLVGGVEG